MDFDFPPGTVLPARSYLVVAASLEALGRRFQIQLDSVAMHGRLHDPGGVRFFAAENMLGFLDQRDLAAETAEHLAELQPDIAPAGTQDPRVDPDYFSVQVKSHFSICDFQGSQDRSSNRRFPGATFSYQA